MARGRLIRKDVELSCDRCGNTTTLVGIAHVGEYTTRVRDAAARQGWATAPPEDLCPTCAPENPRSDP